MGQWSASRAYKSAQPSHFSAFHPKSQGVAPMLYSAALCRGLIEAHNGTWPTHGARSGIPRLYAAASLKLQEEHDRHRNLPRYSAALCRGLIEAC